MKFKSEDYGNCVEYQEKKHRFAGRDYAKALHHSGFSRTQPEKIYREHAYRQGWRLTIEVSENPSPSGDAWFDNAENTASVKRGLEDIEAGRCRAHSMDEIRKILGVWATHLFYLKRRLKGDLAGLWSRRIDKGNRLIYRIEDEMVTVFVVSAKGHYDSI